MAIAEHWVAGGAGFIVWRCLSGFKEEKVPGKEIVCCLWFSAIRESKLAGAICRNLIYN
jgi:hypothetical protein